MAKTVETSVQNCRKMNQNKFLGMCPKGIYQFKINCKGVYNYGRYNITVHFKAM